MTDFFIFRHNVDGFLCQRFGITVQQTNPLDPFHCCQFFQQFMKFRFTVKISAINGSILCHNDQFLHALFCQNFCFFHQTFHGAASVFAAHFGNDTVSAVVVTAFRNFQISEIRRCGKDTQFAVFVLHGLVDVFQTFEGMFASQNSVSGICHFFISSSTQDSVYFGNLIKKFRFVTLSQAACHNQTFALAFCFIFRHFQNGFNAFFQRVPDETAGIDYNDVCLRFVRYCLITSLLQQPQHDFTVYAVFVTAQRGKCYRSFHWFPP